LQNVNKGSFWGNPKNFFPLGTLQEIGETRFDQIFIFPIRSEWRVKIHLDEKNRLLAHLTIAPIPWEPPLSLEHFFSLTTPAFQPMPLSILRDGLCVWLQRPFENREKKMFVSLWGGPLKNAPCRFFSRRLSELHYSSSTRSRNPVPKKPNGTDRGPETQKSQKSDQNF
jgi:hypothetical protein